MRSTYGHYWVSLPTHKVVEIVRNQVWGETLQTCIIVSMEWNGCMFALICELKFFNFCKQRQILCEMCMNEAGSIIKDYNLPTVQHLNSCWCHPTSTNSVGWVQSVITFICRSMLLIRQAPCLSDNHKKVFVKNSSNLPIRKCWAHWQWHWCAGPTLGHLIKFKQTSYQWSSFSSIGLPCLFWASGKYPCRWSVRIC